MSEGPTADWNPTDPSVLHDQRRAYDELRERCPVAFSEFLGRSLFRHEDVVGVLDDPYTYSNVSRHLAIPNGMDPPQHTLYRRALESYFTRADGGIRTTLPASRDRSGAGTRCARGRRLRH